MQTHMLSLDKGVKNLNIDRELCWNHPGLMQEQNYNALMYEEEQRLNMSKRQEIVPRHKFVSPPYYWKDHENEKFEQIVQNFEPSICYVVEQKVTT